MHMQMTDGGETKEDDENNDNDSATRKVTDRQFLYHILKMVVLVAANFINLYLLHISLSSSAVLPIKYA